MPQVDTLDITVLVALLLGTVIYFAKGSLWPKAEDPYAQDYGSLHPSTLTGKVRDIIQKMEETGKNCVMFFGSQTGTAEDYASRLAKEGSQRFGLKTMIADLEEYDFDNLDKWPEDKLAFFVMATYGEGEPTDNAVDFYTYITEQTTDSQNKATAEGKPLSNLRFVAFGLGNNTYEHYNFIIRDTDRCLKELGASRIGEIGEGDDGSGTMEEDYLAWKERMWAAVTKEFGLEERETSYEPTFVIEEQDCNGNGNGNASPINHKDESTLDLRSNVFVGEPTKKHLGNAQDGVYSSVNPYIAPIVQSRELFFVQDRNCLHMEIDISGTNLSYETGDHIAIWPQNSGFEVNRMLKVLGLEKKRHQVIDIKPVDVTAKAPFPSPTTYDAALRYYMEICGPASRQLFSSLSEFAPDEVSKAEMKKLGNDKDYFSNRVSSRCLNVSQALEAVTLKPFTAVPFSLIVESIQRIQPRYYSISSSPLVQRETVSITAVVENTRFSDNDQSLRGVTTNYLLALKNLQNNEHSPAAHLQYILDGPRGKFQGIKLPVHIRHSNFKPPSDYSRPIIMVGPGTGVAPFKAFVEERVKLASQGNNVGLMILFYGCRKEHEDFLYKSEWKHYAELLGDKFKLITAFSRASSQKVYVQHRMQENATLVNGLLEQKANFYVCGDASNMAREVNATLVRIISEQRHMEPRKAEEFVKSMRSAGLYQEDVWS